MVGMNNPFENSKPTRTAAANTRAWSSVPRHRYHLIQQIEKVIGKLWRAEQWLFRHAARNRAAGATIGQAVALIT
jgi:hypothetical protein